MPFWWSLCRGERGAGVCGGGSSAASPAISQIMLLGQVRGVAFALLLIFLYVQLVLLILSPVLSVRQLRRCTATQYIWYVQLVLQYITGQQWRLPPAVLY